MIVIIIVILIVILYFARAGFGKLIDLIISRPKLSISVLLISFLVTLYISASKLREIYFENHQNGFWYQVLRKNSQPINITFDEYATKNRIGYCWRDKKFYSKDDLKQKALKSLAGRMIFENQFYWNNKAIVGQGDPRGARYHCKKNNACKVIIYPVDLKNQKPFSLTDESIKISSRKNLFNLADKNSLREYIFTSDIDFINDEFDSKKFFLISKNVYGYYGSLYSSEQAILLNKTEWLILRRKYNEINSLGIELESKYEGKYNYSLPPQSIDLDSWGVGNYYLEVNNEVYILNNCGDILYSPYYYKKMNEKVDYNS